jgi:hypothetical protein
MRRTYSTIYIAVKISVYENLSSLAVHAWSRMDRIGGRICYRNITGNDDRAAMMEATIIIIWEQRTKDYRSFSHYNTAATAAATAYQRLRLLTMAPPSASSSSAVLPGQEEPLKRLAKIITSFLSRPDSGPFNSPVDWRGLELYDYPEICPVPMDLGTVQRNLDRGRYATASLTAADIRLVWKNCMTYNAVGSDFWLLAKAYSKRFEDRYRKIKQICT